MSVRAFFIIDFIYSFLERGEGREKEREETVSVVASRAPPTVDLVHNPGMCPDWESNWQTSGLQSVTQSTEPHQPGQGLLRTISA